jgi:uncharacterized membrane protein YeaQ/YmgE (transglycosylase-associated protein family)
MNPSYGILIWLVTGAIVGCIGNKIMGTGARQAGIPNIFIGMLGAAIGGYFAPVLADASRHNGLLMSVFVAFGGACLAILTWTTLVLLRRTRVQ